MKLKLMGCLTALFAFAGDSEELRLIAVLLEKVRSIEERLSKMDKKMDEKSRQDPASRQRPYLANARAQVSEAKTMKERGKLDEAEALLMIALGELEASSRSDPEAVECLTEVYYLLGQVLYRRGGVNNVKRAISLLKTGEGIAEKRNLPLLHYTRFQLASAYKFMFDETLDKERTTYLNLACESWKAMLEGLPTNLTEGSELYQFSILASAYLQAFGHEDPRKVVKQEEELPQKKKRRARYQG